MYVTLAFTFSPLTFPAPSEVPQWAQGHVSPDLTALCNCLENDLHDCSGRCKVRDEAACLSFVLSGPLPVREVHTSSNTVAVIELLMSKVCDMDNFVYVIDVK